MTGSNVNRLHDGDALVLHAEDVNALRVRYGFTNREAEVALLIVARRSNLEIAEHLGISRHTARHHVQAVLLKLNVRSRVSARLLLIKARQAGGNRQ